jgi:biopolymer transport protein ExbD
MAFEYFEESCRHKPLSEINMIPLIDIMLVLLILFIITAPLFTFHAIKIDVPKTSNQALSNESHQIILSIDGKGILFWNDKYINDQTFVVRIAQIAQKKPQPELLLSADKNLPYQKVAEIMSAVQKAGITRLGLLTEPIKNAE